MKTGTVLWIALLAVAGLGAFYLYRKSQSVEQNAGNPNARNRDELSDTDKAKAYADIAVNTIDKIGDVFGGW